MLFEGKELSKVVAVSYKEEFVCIKKIRKHHAKLPLEGKQEVILLNSKIASCFHGEVHAAPVVGW